MVPDRTVQEYLERIVPLQETYNEYLTRIAEIKREARGDGLKMEAVNALLPLLVKHPHDKGAAVINEMIRYAEAYGAEGVVSSHSAALPPVPAQADATEPAQADPSSSPHADAAPSGPALARAGRIATAETQAMPQPTPAATRWLARIDPTRGRMAAQAVLGLCVTAGLLWFLH